MIADRLRDPPSESPVVERLVTKLVAVEDHEREGAQGAVELEQELGELGPPRAAPEVRRREPVKSHEPAFHRPVMRPDVALDRVGSVGEILADDLRRVAHMGNHVDRTSASLPERGAAEPDRCFARRNEG